MAASNGIDIELPPPLDSEYPEIAWGILKFGEYHQPLWIARPKITNSNADDKSMEKQVRFEMLYAGICHTDLHFGRNELGNSLFPMVAGHELLGRVIEIGSKVTKVKVGDFCAVGTLVGSCKSCKNCDREREQFCLGTSPGKTPTYNGIKGDLVGGNKSIRTMGGYSAANTVHEDFIIKVPNGMDLKNTAPLVCAGITMYSPLKYWGATGKEKMTVGIIGIGGLGTMGIKLAKALGNDVMAISTSFSKEAMAKEKGATMFACSKDPESMKANAGKCDLILNTVSADHDINTYLPLLAKGGSTIVQLGVVTKPHSVSQFPLMQGRISIAGSLTGGIQETQEVVDLCFKHGVYPDCKIVEAKDIDWCWQQLDKTNADGIRYVIDIKKSLQNKDFIPK